MSRLGLTHLWATTTQASPSFALRSMGTTEDSSSLRLDVPRSIHQHRPCVGALAKAAPYRLPALVRLVHQRALKKKRDHPPPKLVPPQEPSNVRNDFSAATLPANERVIYPTKVIGHPPKMPQVLSHSVTSVSILEIRGINKPCHPEQSEGAHRDCPASTIVGPKIFLVRVIP